MIIQFIFGIMWIFTQTALGSLFQNPVICRFNERNQCYVALGQQLHLEMLPADGFVLNFINKIFSLSLLLKYGETQCNHTTPDHSRWQFIKSKTMTLARVERSDSGTYSFDTFDVNGINKHRYDLQLNTEAQVSSVKVSYSCSSPGVMKVSCSADGDNLRFSWTSDLNTLPQMENGNSTLILDKKHHGNVTCSVENHVSRDNITTELQPCPGLLVNDRADCRFNESNQCYAALGQQLHLQIPLEDGFNLKITDKTFTDRTIFKYRKSQSNSQTNIPRWQFVNDNKTLILTSAERSDSGTYTLDTFDAGGTNKGSYTLQLKIEVMVSSVKVWYSCLSFDVTKVYCSAEGDNLLFIWKTNFNSRTQLEDMNRTLLMDKNPYGNITCHAENHVSYARNTIELLPCPAFTVFLSVWIFEVIILLTLLVGAFYIYTRLYKKQTVTQNQELCNPEIGSEESVHDFLHAAT